ncbi:type IV pilus twitching motility protein PilT [Cryobacterium tagatosivorans]|nr:type IV pilus twitching motility protein PilT [Cryobacterium tagatosivorans]
MNQPIYEIPVTPPGTTAASWSLSEPDTGLAAAAAAAAAEAAGATEVEPDFNTPALRQPSGLPDGQRGQFGGVAEAEIVTFADRPRRSRAGDTNAPDPDLMGALAEVLDLNASDLHVTVGAPPSIRVDGGLRPIEGSTKWMRDKVLSALYSILTPAQREEFERELELDFAYTAGGARFRVNYYQQRSSIGGAFRLIPREIKQLKDLGVPESVAQFAAIPRGLVLVTGPTGSGKSTTLAALVDLVNRTRADHIVTVEDPIEFLHRHQKSLVNQREVGSDTHSFASALKHVLRQDPDVILIGELRDLETISVALTAAETGHLVFATLHTQSAAQTIDRVIDVFPPHQQGQVRAQLAATLQGVVCQTLVKKVGGGRVVATEVLVTTSGIANLIREGKTYQIASAMQAGRAQGMHTMDQHLAELVNSGLITRHSAEEKAQDLEGLAQLIRRVDPTDDPMAGGIDFGDSFSPKGK